MYGRLIDVLRLECVGGRARPSRYLRWRRRRPAVDGAAVDGPAVEGAAVDGPGVTGLAVAGPAVEGGVSGAAEGVAEGAGVAGGVSVEGVAVRGAAGAAPRCWRLSASSREARSSTRVVSSVSEVVSPSRRRLSASSWRCSSAVCPRMRASTARVAAASASVRARWAACWAATTSPRSWSRSSCDAVPVTSCNTGASTQESHQRGEQPHGEEAAPPHRRVSGRQRGLTRKCARRFLAQHSSVFSVQRGRSSP